MIAYGQTRFMSLAVHLDVKYNLLEIYACLFWGEALSSYSWSIMSIPSLSPRGHYFARENIILNFRLEYWHPLKEMVVSIPVPVSNPKNMYWVLLGDKMHNFWSSKINVFELNLCYHWNLLPQQILMTLQREWIVVAQFA